MTLDEMFLVLAVAALVVAIPLGLYVWSIYNDLVTRRERLHALLGNAQSMQARRHGIGKVITQHVSGSARHVENAVRHASRGKRGGANFKINADGFPEQRNVELVGRGLDADVHSFDIENQVYLSLHQEAAEYNARLRRFPCCLIAPVLGFRPWKTHGRPGGGYQRRRGGQGGFRRRRP